MSIRMIMHIGTGKTGSTAIQKHFRLHRSELVKQGCFYWGLNLEHAPTKKKRDWQKPGGVGLLQRMGIDEATEQLSNALTEAITHMPDNCTVIWSNESIYEMPFVYQPVIRSVLSRENINISLVAYARSIPSFILSAYKQWGIKHKTNRGPIMPFGNWVEASKKFLAYPTQLKQWDEEFSTCFKVFNYDQVDDVVCHFIKNYDLPLEGLEGGATQRQYSTPDDIILSIYALYNNQFNGTVLPNKISRLIAKNKLTTLNFRLTPVSSIYPAREEINQYSSFIHEQTSEINKILVRNDQPQLNESLDSINPTKPAEDQIITGVLSALLGIIINQDDRIDQLERLVQSQGGIKENPVQQESEHR